MNCENTNNLPKLIEVYIKETLSDGLQECDLSGASYGTIDRVLHNMGYRLSSDNKYFDEAMYTNSWEHDYYMYIFKDSDYTGYCLYGSLYYGNHKIEKDETDRI